MTTGAITRLQERERLHLRGKYPNVPAYALAATKYSDKSANGLTRCIIDWLKLNGWQAERINTTGRPIDKRKSFLDAVGRGRTVGRMEWIPGTGTRGSADISATIAGRSVKIEVKAGKDRQSEHQKKYQAEIEQAGGVYLIARTFEGFLCWYDEFLK